jgi:protein gp37
MSRMFPFVTKTCNPLSGECLHKCTYCWARALIAQHKMGKYKGESRLDERAYLNLYRFTSTDVVFVCDMCDLFGPWVSSELIRKVLERIKQVRSQTTWLFLTKNPARYVEFLSTLQHIDCILGVTLETDRSTERFSRALKPIERWSSFYELEYSPKFVAIEPIMDFDLDLFSDWLFNITNLESVAVGYDNYNNHLPEPSLDKTMQLIEQLEKARIKVYRKTLREAWR